MSKDTSGSSTKNSGGGEKDENWYYISSSPMEDVRSANDRPSIKLSVNLLKTYNEINRKFYAKHARRKQRSASAHKKAAGEGKGKKNKRDDSKQNYIVRPREVFNNRYVVEELIGKGSFGRVVKAMDTQTKRHVAIKIIKNSKPFFVQAQTEIKILNTLQAGVDDYNIVRVTDTFVHANHQCIVFEYLWMNLFELLKTTRFVGVSLSMIRKFARQLLVSLGYLRQPKGSSKGIIHCDLKPENILLCSPEQSTVKVIDFGSACFEDKKMYTYIQSRFYRSPEVLLGCPYGCPIDIWSLGCILVEMHTGRPLFNGRNESDQVIKQIGLLGIPPREMLYKSRHYSRYFEGRKRDSGPAKLQPRMEGKLAQHKKTLVEALGDKYEDTDEYKAFIDLVMSMLEYEPDRRVTPEDALSHRFFTDFRKDKDQSKRDEDVEHTSSVTGGAGGVEAMDDEDGDRKKPGSKTSSKTGNSSSGGSGKAGGGGAGGGDGDVDMTKGKGGVRADSQGSSNSSVRMKM